MSDKVLIIAALLTLLPQAASAQDQARPNALVDAVAQCLAVTNDAERLACHDKAGRALVEAARTRELVVVDRAEARRTRRSLFGLPVDLGSVFAGRDRPEERFEALDTSVASAGETGGRWTLRLAEGGTWRTLEELRFSRAPRPGTRVTVERGALGSYVLKAEGARAVRAQRVN